MPIQQFGAILGACTLVAALLVMAISPIAMLPPFRLEVPVRLGSHSPVAGLMNRLILWVYLHPARDRRRGVRHRAAAGRRDVPSRYESNYINLFRPETRVVRDYHTVESQLGGIGLVELIVPVGPAMSPHVAVMTREPSRIGFAAIRVSGPDGDRAGALAGHGARPRRPAGRPAPTIVRTASSPTSST